VSGQYRWKSEVESLEMDGEWILINADEFTLTKLGDVGGFIWSNLRGACTSERIVNLVLEEYSVSRDEVEQDVQQFLHQLIHLGLVENCVG
jgi:hypothetical protein